MIKRRLLFDGDGTGDDRRLNLMLKMIAKHIYSSEENPQEPQVFQKLLAQLNLCELSRNRSELVHKATEAQKQQYIELHKEYEQKIADIKKEIEVKQKELEQAKQMKQNKIMYDLLAQSVAKEPTRQDTNSKLTDLQSELKDLSEMKKKCDLDLDQRRKQCYVLSTSANALAGLIENDEKVQDTSMNESLDDVANSPGPEPMSE